MALHPSWALRACFLWALLLICALRASVAMTPGGSHTDAIVPSHNKNAPGVQSTTITYQVHSYNDLNEWPQILKKKTNYFKIDPHYMDASFCKSQKRFYPQDPRGCFVLNHDDPLTQTQYNFTDDVLTVLADPSNAQFFQDPTQRIHIALCWKYLDNKSPCDNDATAQNWTSLVNDFFTKANSAVAQYNLNVEFIMDGAGTPSGRSCLLNLWRPWVSTWIPSSDPAEAAFSNNATLGYDHFQVFNAPDAVVKPALWIDYYQNFGYGKFSAGNYSYLLWEPSGQSDILTIASSYLNGPIHEAGFRFAINTDPAMLQTYAGSMSGSAWNYNIVREGVVDYPQVDVIHSQKDNSTFYILTVYYNYTDMTSHYTISWAPHWTSEALSTVVSLNTSALSTAMRPVMNVSSVSVVGSTVFVSSSGGLYAIYSFNEDTLSLSLVASGVFENSNPDYPVRTNAFLAEGDAGGDFHVLQLRKSPHLLFCQLYAQLWYFVDNQPVPVGGSKCIQSGASVVDFDLAVLSGSSDTQACGNAMYPGMIMYSDSDFIVYAVYICVDLMHKTITINGNRDETNVVYVDVGSAPSVSMVQLNNEVYVLSIHGESYCWNSETHNKQASQRLCDNSPFSMPYMLTYNFGKWDDWVFHISQILTNKNPADRLFGSCHSTILHGTHDSGTHPSAALFTSVDPLLRQEALVFAEVHRGLPPNTVDKYACGMPVSMQGLVLDGWPINNWVLD